MTITVNGNEGVEAGCYIAGHHGQYGLDALGDVADQFGILLDDEDDPRYWRRGAEAETSEDTIIISNGPNRIGNHIARADECMERQVWAADKVEELLNEATTGGFWTWEDGELFLVEEIEATEDRDLVDWSDASEYEIALGLDN